MAGEENRHQMMQNLFGDQSEEEDEEEEVESEHESNRQVAYASVLIYYRLKNSILIYMYDDYMCVCVCMCVFCLLDDFLGQ